MRTTLKALEASRATRPRGYVDAIIAAGHHHHITPETLASIRRQYCITEPPFCRPVRGLHSLIVGVEVTRL